ncbi:cytochrome P450 [Herpetosiphon llansteffanensis]|uniref:cytochrome P450 n=1 Tax=Herpetosiphon llansteffanensis TaxID=2094568 RepID=UPI000D7CCADE|nr:cytochrome P450 [Herpetosiphon llansteffanensis]
MTTAVRSIPHRRSRLALDIALEVKRQGTLQFFESTWRRYGDLAHLQLGSQDMFLIVHPDHVKRVMVEQRDTYSKKASYEGVRKLLLGDGLVASTGSLWRRQRKLMAPFFTPRSIETYLPIMVDDGVWFRERWSAAAKQGEPLDILTEMSVLTASIILKSMFTLEADETIAWVKHAVETMIGFASSRQMNPLHAPLWMPTPKNRAYLDARKRVNDYIQGIIAERQRQAPEHWPNDLLTRMMQARDEETGEPMSTVLLRDEAITVFFAGHETTARTLSFLWYALANNPEVAERMQAEIDSVLGDNPPTLELLKQLPYTLQVIKETLRLYPAAPMYARDAVATDEFDGIKVPIGARMTVMPYLTHRHPDFWDDPLRFDPDRWLPEREAQRHPFAYHPFAAGQRICIGNNFSLFESHVIVAMLARHFALRNVPGHTPQIWMDGTLGSRNGLPMFITQR